MIKKYNINQSSFIAISAQFFDSNQIKRLPKVSILSYVFNFPDDCNDLKLIIWSQAKFKINNKADFPSNLFFIKVDKK